MAIHQYIEAIAENYKRGIPTKVAPPFDISSQAIQQISEKLQLSFISEEEMERTSEVCFANSPEVRPEFRSTFTAKDALDYFYAVLYSSKFQKEFEKHLRTGLKSLPIPSDIFIFCKLAVLGSELQIVHMLQSPYAQMSVAAMESQRIISEIDNVLNAS